MSDSAIIKQLGLDAWSRDDITSSGVIPYVERALALIRQSTEPQERLESALVDVVTGGGDPEFVELCCNVLSWPSLRSRFEQLLAHATSTNDMRSAPIAMHVLEAFDPSWRDDKEEFYGDFLASQAAI